MIEARGARDIGGDDASRQITPSRSRRNTSGFATPLQARWNGVASPAPITLGQKFSGLQIGPSKSQYLRAFPKAADDWHLTKTTEILLSEALFLQSCRLREFSLQV